MTERMTPKAELADVLLESDGGVKKFILVRRMRARPLSWPAIAEELAEATAGRVRVTGTSVAAWISDDDFGSPAAGPAMVAS